MSRLTNTKQNKKQDDMMDKDDDRKMSGRVFRKKICRFCSDADLFLDYKDTRLMQAFLTEHGRLVPRRLSGNCAHHQRKLTAAVKRARMIAIVGFMNQSY